MAQAIVFPGARGVVDARRGPGAPSPATEARRFASRLAGWGAAKLRHRRIRAELLGLDDAQLRDTGIQKADLKARFAIRFRFSAGA